MSSSERIPPRFVPTLTEVVHMPEPVAPASIPVSAPSPLSQDAAPDGEGLLQVAVLQQEVIVHRVMQRVDLALEDRLREAVFSVVMEQVRAMAPRLRDAVELVVREVVSEAVAGELATVRERGDEGR